MVESDFLLIVWQMFLPQKSLKQLSILILVKHQKNTDMLVDKMLLSILSLSELAQSAYLKSLIVCLAS